MSPSSFNSAGWAGVFTVGSSGYLSSINVQGTYVVRSVINLKADINVNIKTDKYVKVKS